MSANPTGDLARLAECAALGRRLGPRAAARALARRQHGVVARRQLLALGARPRAIDARVRSAELTPVHRGVYVLGPIAGRRAEEAAAVLCVRRGAWVARRSALHLLGALGSSPKPDPVEVVALIAQSRRPRLIAHRADLRPDEITVHEGIPCTTAARAIVDLAGSVEVDALEYMLAQAFAARVTNRARLLRQLQRRRGQSGARALRALLDSSGPGEVRSPPELQLLRLLRSARLTPVRANARIGQWEVDFLWEEQRVIVEVDVLSTHSDPRAFERDRRKDAELVLAGYTVIRVTRRQIESEPHLVVARIATALARVGAG